jgi:hypothetical protein
MSVRSLERARLQAAPYIVFEDLGHGWEAVPVQKVATVFRNLWKRCATQNWGFSAAL